MTPIRTAQITMRENHFAALLILAQNLRRDQVNEFAADHQQREEIIEAVWVLSHAIKRANVTAA